MSEELQHLLATLRRPAESLPSLATLDENELARLRTAVDVANARYDRAIRSSLTQSLPAAVVRWLARSPAKGKA